MDLRIRISREFLAVCRSKQDLERLHEAVRKPPKKSKPSDRDYDSTGVATLSAEIHRRN
jgi:hypothetical protein